MSRFTLLATCLACAVLPFIACDEDTSAPPTEDPFVPLLDGDWTLRVSPDTHIDEFLLPVTFTATEDTVILTTSEGDFGVDLHVRQVLLDLECSPFGDLLSINANLTLDDQGASLTGSIYGITKTAGDLFIGTLFGVPDSEVPDISVSISPSTITLPQQAALQLIANVTGWRGNYVTWSLDPEGAGTITASGRYTAPLWPPDPPLVTVTAISTIDIGARDDATINIEVPPPTCDTVHGSWEAHILVETAYGFQDDCYELAYWFIVQDECSLILSDRGMIVELEMIGGYATGVLQIPRAQYTYMIHFENGLVIREGSGIEYLSLIEPTEPHFRPVLGFKRF